MTSQLRCVTSLLFVALMCTQMHAQDAEVAEQSAVAAEEQGNDAPKADQFVFRLKNGKEFKGFLDEDSAVVMVIADTKLKIPMFKVGSMTFDANRPGTASVELRNGDRVTAQFEPSAVELVAEWGKVTLNTGSVTSIRLTK